MTTVIKSCQLSNICQTSNIGNSTNGQINKCCTTNQCNNESIRPIVATTTLASFHHLKCYHCNDCGYNNIGLLTNCPIDNNYYCYVRFLITSDLLSKKSSMSKKGDFLEKYFFSMHWVIKLILF